MATFTEAQRVGSEYGAAGMDADRYGKSLLGLIMLLTQAAGHGRRRSPSVTPLEYVQDPRIVVAYALLVVTWGSAVRRRQWLVLLVTLPTLLLIPCVNQRWQPILASRYIMPLLPLLLVTFGGFAADALWHAAGCGQPLRGAAP